MLKLVLNLLRRLSQSDLFAAFLTVYGQRKAPALIPHIEYLVRQAGKLPAGVDGASRKAWVLGQVQHLAGPLHAQALALGQSGLNWAIETAYQKILADLEP